jgi:hypothetical protein
MAVGHLLFVGEPDPTKLIKKFTNFHSEFAYCDAAFVSRDGLAGAEGVCSLADGHDGTFLFSRAC